MCGINGYLGGGTEKVQGMNRVLGHRGPDGSGVFDGGKIVLGHERLAIIDLSERGKQPMQNSDGSLIITYNGELYNFKELKHELSSYQFVSETDTEVILAAYEKWGKDCVKRFNGIFAFAIWDARNEELFLARDQMGVKPLYYFHEGATFVFSSEVKAILEYGVRAKLNTEALTRLLHVGDVVGNESLITGVKKLPPANSAMFRDGSLELSSYWQPTLDQKEKRTKQEWIEKIQVTVDVAIERQLISDRPVGVALSGGIDSSSVLASVAKHQSNVKTYTTRFTAQGCSVEHYNADADIAKRTAAYFGTTHTEVIVDADTVIERLEKAVWHMDEPTSSSTALSQLALAETAARDVPVLLGGEGGDELFGGYTRYRLNLAMEQFHRAPLWLQQISVSLVPRLRKLKEGVGFEQFLKLYCTDGTTVGRVLGDHYPTGHLRSYYERELLPPASLSSSDLLMEIDRRLLTDGSLMRGDKLLMAAGVEGRVPLLDLELIELALKIPAYHKVTLFDTKRIFKEAMRDRLPEYLFKERKRGWVTPASVWLHEPKMQAYVKEVLSPGYYAGTEELCDWDEVHAIVNQFYTREGSARALIWTLVGLQVWARRFSIEL